VLEGFELVKHARPIRAELTREAAVGERLSIGLASGTVEEFGSVLVAYIGGGESAYLSWSVLSAFHIEQFMQRVPWRATV
jgi:hypothetical protein